MQHAIDSGRSIALARTWSRRDALRWLARGAAGLLTLPRWFEVATAHGLAQAAPGARRKHLILLWLDGGPSQLETFDPKPGTPNGGPWKALPTDVAGWSFAEPLPQLARRAEQLAVVRTLTSRESSHARARQLMHWGYSPNPSVDFPSLGAIVAHEIGDLDHDLPAFVQILGLEPWGPGDLGITAAPFFITDPTTRVENLAERPAVDRTRALRRDLLRRRLDAEFAARGGAAAVAEQEVQLRRARRLMDSKLRPVFDLKREQDDVRERYGLGRFGQGVLMARRLVEAGVAAVEVALDGWDTHTDNFRRTRALCDELDPAFSALLDDLAERGLLADTLVVCVGEFGRTPTVAVADGRHHWPNNYCAVLAGGGVRTGQAIGTTDELGETIAARPVPVADLHATIAQLLGIDGARPYQSGIGRELTLVDPNGRAVTELLRA